MPVTDDQVATLRAQLARNPNEHYRRLRSLDKEAASTGYTALVTAAFFEAVERRFPESTTFAEVIEYVGSLRARSQKAADDIDPSAAERLIQYSLGADVPIGDLDARTKFATQIFLLGVIADELELDDVELDKFMAKARAIADDWTR